MFAAAVGRGMSFDFCSNLAKKAPLEEMLVEADDNDHLPLHHAIKCRKLDIIMWLIVKGIEVRGVRGKVCGVGCAE